MKTMKSLTVDLFVTRLNENGIKVSGGTIHDYLRNCKIKYYGGRCPVYQVEYVEDEARAVIGGNFATNGKPSLTPLYELDYSF
jgi:hypothetical protein